MSTIIKAATGTRSRAGSAHGHAVFNFEDMSVRADKYLDEIRAQAATILQEAQRQAEQIRRQAETDGRQAALAAAERLAEEKVAGHMKTLLPALEKSVADIAHAKASWLAHWNECAVKVAIAIAARVIRREVATQPEITVDWIREALELAAGGAAVTLHLHPTDLENLSSQIEKLTSRMQSLAPTHVVAASDVSPGGCRVETQFGAIDQQIEAQLARIEEELTA